MSNEPGTIIPTGWPEGYSVDIDMGGFILWKDRRGWLEKCTLGRILVEPWVKTAELARLAAWEDYDKDEGLRQEAKASGAPLR